MSILLKSILGLSAIMFVLPLLAQPGGPPATPIDGGLSALLAAGGLYGLKKIRESRMKD